MRLHGPDGATEAPPQGEAAWYCVRSQPKHEHIAAAHLSQEGGLEVFLPRISFKRPTRRGVMRVTEALFPNYLFARFDLAANLRLVRHTRGVTGVVHFGHRWPVIPNGVISELRALVGTEAPQIVPVLSRGDHVRIVGGHFHGLEALVERAMPGRERVAVLLEFLGRQSLVELPRDRVVPEVDLRRGLLP